MMVCKLKSVSLVFKNKASLQDAENAPKVSCMRCGARVPITVIRDHQQDCMGYGKYVIL